MKDLEILAILEKYEPRSYHTQLPLVWGLAQGERVFANGRYYFDFTSGIFTANCGHSNEYIRSAVLDMVHRMSHSYSFATEIRAKLVKKLCEMTGYEKVFLCTTGSEAVEAALRCMGGDVTSLPDCFHGNTLGSKALQKGDLEYDMWPDKSPYIGTGIIFESYYGWNAQFHPIKWVQEWRAHARFSGVPVCFDEIQAGFGRTGKLFGYEWYEVKPDLVVVGKALGNGLPISAVLGSAELLDGPDDLSSTHSGNPVCCAAALATLEYIEESKLVEKSARNESIFLSEFEGLPYKVNGHGTVWAILLDTTEFATKVVERCAEKGLLLLKTNKPSIKIGPPLTISEGGIMWGMKVIKEAINECKA